MNRCSITRFNNSLKIGRFQRRAANEAAVDLRLCHQFCRIARLHAAAVLNADGVGDCLSEQFGDSGANGGMDFLRVREQIGGLWLLVKTSIVVFLLSVIRASFARIRIDQIVTFSWKYLAPASLIQLLAVLILKGNGVL